MKGRFWAAAVLLAILTQLLSPIPEKSSRAAGQSDHSVPAASLASHRCLVSSASPLACLAVGQHSHHFVLGIGVDGEGSVDEGVVAGRGESLPEAIYVPSVLLHYDSGTTPTNRPPYKPSNPSPPNRASDQRVNVDLGWTGGDPDGDSVTYDVYLEANDSTPNEVVCNDVTTTSCDPGTLKYGTHYYWKVVARDEHGATAARRAWEFTTRTVLNNPPHAPSNPSPADGATKQGVKLDLSWTGGDPDGDGVTYDVYLEADDSSPENLTCNDVSSASCDPGVLNYGTHYYWKVAAADEHGSTTPGAVWEFTTSSAPFAFSDDFEQGIDNWTPYTNLNDLLPEQWYWDQDGGYGGSAGYTFDHSLGGKTPEDALTMYLGEGSEEWTDYRASARFNVRQGVKAGLWLRGTYRDQGFPGQWFLGYYCIARVKQTGDGYVQLFQMRTLEDPGDPPPLYERNYYHFTNPYELDARKITTALRPNQWYRLTVEARGGNIKCWVNDELAVDDTDTYGSIFLNGTIGLKVFGSSAEPAVVSFDDVAVESLD
jgi:hypothetical protein